MDVRDQALADIERRERSGLYDPAAIAAMKDAWHGEAPPPVTGVQDAFGNWVGTIGGDLTGRSSDELRQDLARFGSSMDPGVRLTLGGTDAVESTRQRMEEVVGLDVERLGDEFLWDRSRGSEAERTPDPTFRIHYRR